MSTKPADPMPAETLQTSDTQPRSEVYPLLSVGDLLLQLDEQLYPLGEAPHNNAHLQSDVLRVANTGADMAVYQEFVDDERAMVPMPLKVLYGVGAWLMALLLCLFLSIFSIYQSGIAMLIFGALVTVVGQALSKDTRDVIQQQIMLTTSLVGQAFLVAGLVFLLGMGRDHFTAMFCIILQSALFIVNKDTFHRFLSVIIASAALAYIIMHWPAFWPFVLTAYAWGCVLLWAPDKVNAWLGLTLDVQLPLKYGLAFSLLGGLYVSSTKSIQVPGWLWPCATLGIGLAWGWLALGLMKERKVGWNGTSITIAASFAVFGLCLFNAPGILASGLLFTLGFANRSYLIMRLSLIATVAYTSAFYYHLDFSPLSKGLSLLLPGILLLFLRAFLLQQNTPKKGASHA